MDVKKIVRNESPERNDCHGCWTTSNAVAGCRQGMVGWEVLGGFEDSSIDRPGKTWRLGRSCKVRFKVDSCSCGIGTCKGAFEVLVYLGGILGCSSWPPLWFRGQGQICYVFQKPLDLICLCQNTSLFIFFATRTGFSFLKIKSK